MLLVFSFVSGISATTEEWIGLIDEGMIKQQNADAQHRSGIMQLLLFEGIGLLIGAKGKKQHAKQTRSRKKRHSDTVTEVPNREVQQLRVLAPHTPCRISVNET